MQHWMTALGVALALLAQPALADRLDLTGVLIDSQGNPLAGQVLRIVPGGEDRPRAREALRRPDAGHRVTTDALGRFSLRSEVTVLSRRIELDVPGVRHPSRLLELGFEFEGEGAPVLYWAEIDFTRDGPLVGMQGYGLQDGLFATPLPAQDSAADATGEAPPSAGPELSVNRASDGAGGLWRVDVTLTHQRQP